MMEQEAYETIIELNNKLEGSENLDVFGRAIFGLLLFGAAKLLPSEEANKLDFMSITKGIVSEYYKDYRLYHSEEHIMDLLRSLQEYPNLSETNGILLAIAMIYHDIVLLYGTNNINEEMSVKRFLDDFNISEHEYTELPNWYDLNNIDKVIYLIRATAKTPWDFNFTKEHPISIILNGDWSRFNTLKRTKVSDILIKEEVKAFGLTEDVYYQCSKQFFNNILEKFKNIDDIRLKNIKLIYGN